jgi:hypothetical protein
MRLFATLYGMKTGESDRMREVPTGSTDATSLYHPLRESEGQKGPLLCGTGRFACGTIQCIFTGRACPTDPETDSLKASAVRMPMLLMWVGAAGEDIEIPVPSRLCPEITGPFKRGSPRWSHSK